MNRLALFSHSCNAGSLPSVSEVIVFKTAFFTAGFPIENNLITTWQSSADPFKTRMGSLQPWTVVSPV